MVRDNSHCAECGLTARNRVHVNREAKDVWSSVVKKTFRYHPFAINTPSTPDELRIGSMPTPEQIAELMARMEKQQAWASKLIENGYAPMTALIMAGDLVGAQEWSARVNAGAIEPERAAWLVGSYARLDFALAHCPREWVIENIAELWRSSDPDDTNMAVYLPLWAEAARRAPSGYVQDGNALPSPVGRANGRFLTLYRGQMATDKMGMAWTTDEQIAHKFAKGAGVRTTIAGTVYRGFAWRQDVLGFLTGRGESEVVIDPDSVMGVEAIGQYEYVKETGK